MPSEMEIERNRRICVALWACMYELYSFSIVSDSVFDDVCKAVNPSISTNRPDLDSFFSTEFQPHTGQWIYKHPELYKLKQIVEKYYSHRILK